MYNVIYIVITVIPLSHRMKSPQWQAAAVEITTYC